MLTIRGSGDLQHAQSHVDRLSHIIRLDCIEVQVASLTEARRADIVARIARNRERMLEIEVAMRKFRGW